MPTNLHLVYIHGFQGNDTSFKSFPTHLQERLAVAIPEHLNLKVQSSLYPTYKCIKPISNATKNFLEWLSTQPPGPVILLGHSMGGLLAADAATDLWNNPDQYPGAKPKRIVGVVAFDTPYLGMHPHVIMSGIASLLSKRNEPGKKEQSNREMNDQKQVKIVDEKVTDDWEEYKKHLPLHPALNSNYSLSSTPQSIYMSTTSSTPSYSTSPLVDRALSYVSNHSNAPIIRWLQMHSDEPLSAGKRWVVEHFQFGSSMFDPQGLKSRYAHLVQWQGGLWINYWTQTLPHSVKKQLASGESITTETPKEMLLDNNKSLLTNGLISPGTDPTAPEGAIGDELYQSSNASIHSLSSQPPSPQMTPHNIAKQSKQSGTLKVKEKHKQEAHRYKSGKHFIVLPKGLGHVLGGIDKWEQVLIAGVDDEVTAHTGLFIPDRNLDYEGLVDRVKARILSWCEKF